MALALGMIIIGAQGMSLPQDHAKLAGVGEPANLSRVALALVGQVGQIEHIGGWIMEGDKEDLSIDELACRAMDRFEQRVEVEHATEQPPNLIQRLELLDALVLAA